MLRPKVIDGRAVSARGRGRAITSTALDFEGEEMGLKRLLHMGTILQIPQAGLATTDESSKRNAAK
jgi:hypothetical protein